MSYGKGRAFRTLGEGISGIGRTIATLRRERDEQDRIDRRDRLAEDMLFAERGGGRVPAPTMDRTLVGTLPPPERFDAQRLFPEPGSMGISDANLLPPPEFGGREPVTLTSPDPRYAQVGEG